MTPGDPFRLPEPFVVSFSGGRTSGLLLYRILDAYDGKLPPRGKVIFCNTGKERPETLDFVRTVEMAWGVEVHWLEYSPEATEEVRRVDYETAARNGEPFARLIRRKGVLPNVTMRHCTQWLKVKVSNRYARHRLGFTPRRGGYLNAIGLRYDEPQRTARLHADPKAAPGEEPVAPLSAARVTLDDVTAFWAQHSFDLALQPHEGNCDLCFLKGQGKLLRIMRERPDLAAWWIEQERRAAEVTTGRGGRFRKNAPGYEALLRMSQERGLFDLPLATPDDLQECRCTD